MRDTFFLAIIAMAVIFLCTGCTLAETQISTSVKCTGDCTVKQTHNGESVEVSSDSKLAVSTNANDAQANVTIDAEGEDSIVTNLSNGDLNVIRDDNLYENLPDPNLSGSSLKIPERCSLAENSTGSCTEGQNDTYWNESEESYNLSAEELNSSLEEGNAESGGIFQNVYLFFQSFTAKLFWGW